VREKRAQWAVRKSSKCSGEHRGLEQRRPERYWDKRELVLGVRRRACQTSDMWGCVFAQDRYA
jgi:hypothetical protein